MSDEKEKLIFSQNLKYYMQKSGKQQIDLIEDLGINKSTISTWCTGSKMPRMGTIQTLADYFGIKKSDLVEERTEIPTSAAPNIIQIPKTKKVPLIGTIACGEPILAQENFEQYIDMDESIHADFALRCKGDSMINARIFDGDIVYIKIAPQVENGEIAAVLIDGIEKEATLKRFYHLNS